MVFNISINVKWNSRKQFEGLSANRRNVTSFVRNKTTGRLSKTNLKTSKLFDPDVDEGPNPWNGSGLWKDNPITGATCFGDYCWFYENAVSIALFVYYYCVIITYLYGCYRRRNWRKPIVETNRCERAKTLLMVLVQPPSLNRLLPTTTSLCSKPTASIVRTNCPTRACCCVVRRSNSCNLLWMTLWIRCWFDRN